MNLIVNPPQLDMKIFWFSQALMQQIFTALTSLSGSYIFTAPIIIVMQPFLLASKCLKVVDHLEDKSS